MLRAGIVEVALRGDNGHLRRALRQARRESAAFDKSMKGGLRGSQSGMIALGRATSGASASVMSLSKGLGLVSSLAAGYGIYAGIRAFAEFEGTMNNVRAVSGATGSEFALLNQKASDLGATTKFTASQVAESMSFMAMAGLQVGQIYEGVQHTLNLAAAGNLDLGQSADIVTNIMTGMGIASHELGNAVDVLTKTFTSTNTTLTDLGYAFKFAAPAAATAGLEFEEVAAAIGLMGNAGVQGTLAGTAMRGALIRLLDPSKEAKKAMKRIGLEVFDSSGKMRSFVDIVRDLEPVMAKGAAGVKDLAQIFGARPFQGIAAVIRQGADALQVMRGELRNAGGTAQEIADIQMEGLRGAFIELRSAAEGLAVAIGESGLGHAFEKLVDSSTAALRSMTAGLRELAPASEQSLSTLKGSLGDMNSEMNNINRQIMQAQEQVGKPGLGLFGDSSKAKYALEFLESSKEKLAANIANTEELIRLQIRLQESIRPKFTTLVEPVDPDKLPPEVDEETAIAKREAAVRALQRLESQYLEVTLQSRRLISVESARELENFQKLLEQKLISQTEYEDAVQQLAVVTAKKREELNEKQLADIRKIGQSISSNIEGAFRDLIENGKVDFHELTKSILADIAIIALRMAVLQPLFGGGGGGGGGAFGNVIGSIFHSGGIVGSGGTKRSVPAALFVGAPRLHNGGRIGSDEVPAILQRGERVLKKGESGDGVTVQIVNNAGANVKDEGTSTNSNGEMIRRFVIEETNRGMAQGAFDGSMRQRFGAQPLGTRR